MSAERRPDKIYSVSEVNSLANAALESGVGEVWVRGEISGLKIQPSGHVYFSLKDSGSVLNVALFKNSAMKNGVKMQEGKQILVFGTLEIYPPRGSYQMIARFILDEGAGRLQQEFERLKKQLEAEGLFAKERKIEIPSLPLTVAFVTSETGAVWQDFTRILKRRDWRGRVILFPCVVQGPDAPAEIVAALKKADLWPEIDLIVAGRGGGSIEDLWAFNDERVVRAVANMQRPIISAVGHETDFTLCDFAADFRAETPSAAAELIAGHFNDARATIEDLARHLFQSTRRAILMAAQQLQGFYDRLMGRSPRLILDRAYQRIDELSEHLHGTFKNRIASYRERLATIGAHLNGVNPELTLKRGYTLISDKSGKLLTRAAMVETGQEIEINWADGKKEGKIK